MQCRRILVAALVSAGLAGCHGEKDPLSKTHDVVARTVARDLTVPQMSKLLSDAKVRLDLTPENGRSVANLWSTYQRLASAAAHNDTLTAYMTAGITPVLNNDRVTRLLEILGRSLPKDTATEAAYDSGSRGLYAVRHILIAYPAKATPQQRDSVRAAAVALRRTVAAANFDPMARKYSADAQSAARGGYLGVFPKTAMNPTARAVVVALKPDSVSKLVQSQVGFDIIQRLSWVDAMPQYVPAFSRAVKVAHDSVLSEQMAQAANLFVTAAGPEAARSLATNPVRGSRDTTTIATFGNGGRFSAADMLGWVNVMPATQRAQVLKSLPQQSDAAASAFIRGLATRAVLLRAADSARIEVPDSVKSRLSMLFHQDVVRCWTALGVAPEQLADSAHTPTEREQLAARRVDGVIERALAGQVRLPPVSVPVEAALDAEYDVVISSAALAQAVEQAQAMRRAADSASKRGRGP